MNDLYQTLAVARDSIERVMIAASDGLDDNSLRDSARDICWRAGKLEQSVPEEMKVRGPRKVAPPTKSTVEETMSENRVWDEAAIASPDGEFFVSQSSNGSLIICVGSRRFNSYEELKAQLLTGDQ